MAQQIINIGAAANDGTGDPLRTAFDKCNDNFTELYAGSGGGGIGGNTGAADNAILRADGTGGSTLQASGITIADGASGTLSGTNSGDVTLASPNRYLSLAGQQITPALVDLTSHVTGDLPLSSLAQASAEQVLLGRGVGAGAGDFQQITLGTNLSMSGTVLNATGGSGGGNVSGPASPTTDNALTRWDGASGQLIQNSGVTLSDTQEMSGLKSLAFNTAGGTVALASLTWDTTNQTLDLGIGSGTVNALLGVDSHVLGRNTTGSAISRGDVVRVNGASAGNLTIALAQGNTDPNTANTIGIAAENIANSATGMVITSGLLRNLNTSTFAAGDLLYISATTAGVLVNTIPAAPNHAVRMGYVVSAHPSNGIIYVAVSNGYELNELHDVNYPTTPATNDFLVYVTNRWENQSAATARTSMGLGSLATLSTVPYSSVDNIVTNRILGRTTAGTGLAETLTVSNVLDLVTTTQGAIAYRSSAQWFGLAPSTAGYVLTTNGAAANPSWNQVNLASAVTGTLPVGNGGTGATTLTGYVKGTGTAALTASSTIPTSDITGTLPIANGGTGQTTQTAAFDALSPSTTKGDIIVHNGTNDVRLAVGATNGHVLTVDSTTAEGVKWAAASGGGGTSITNVWIPAAQWIPRTTTGCAVDSREQATGNINTDELLFDQAIIEFAQAMVVMPSNYNNGTVTARFYWTASAGTASQGVVWAVRGRAFGDNVALGQTYATGGQGILDTYFAANQMHVSDVTSASTIAGTPAANKAVIFEIFRDASNVNDTLAADARLLGVEIAYTAA